MIFELLKKSLRVDFSKPIDISLPLLGGTDTVNCYHAAPVQYDTIQVGDFVGSTKLGGSCNYQRISFTPHGNGTHTECYGHISEDGATIQACLQQFMFFALLVSVPIEKNAALDDCVALQNLQKSIAQVLDFESFKAKKIEALLIRTLPNEDTKRKKHYSNTNPPYLEAKIGNFLVDLGIKHLLLDLPSVDKEWDNGALSAHRAFWNLPARYEKINQQEIRKDCTITELIFVPNEVQDGHYLLNLQLSSFESDASPSKPILYELL
jgi:arylformamidase